VGDTPFSSFSYALPYGTASRTTAARAADIINFLEFSPDRTGNVDNADLIDAAIAAAFPGGQSDSFSNKLLVFPGGNYGISRSILIRNILGGTILGAGNGATQFRFIGNGASGNSTLPNFPNWCPMFDIDGASFLTFANLTLSGAPQVVPYELVMTTTAGTTAGAGHKTLTVADTSNIKVGMQVGNKTHPTSVLASYVTAIPSGTTVTIADDVAAPGVSSGDTLFFWSHIHGVVMHHTGLNGTTSAPKFFNVNFLNFGIGVYAGEVGHAGNGHGGDANCENGTFYDCNFQHCSYAATRLVGYNTLNWSAIGVFGASECGSVSTFQSGITVGNCSAAVSITNGGLTNIAGYSISGGNNCIDIYHNGSQPLVVSGGRSESMRVCINIDATAPVVFKGWNWGCDNAGGYDVLGFDTSFGGHIILEQCGLAPNFHDAGARKIGALGNAGQFTFHDTIFSLSAANITTGIVTGASSARFTLDGACVVSATPTATDMFASYTGKVVRYAPLEGTTFSALPTAHAKYSGCPMSITDASNTTAVGDTVASGGSKFAQIVGTPAANKVIAVG
jgi:hypothetical protein